MQQFAKRSVPHPTSRKKKRNDIRIKSKPLITYPIVTTTDELRQLPLTPTAAAANVDKPNVTPIVQSIAFPA